VSLFRRFDLDLPSNKDTKELLKGKHLGLWASIIDKKKLEAELKDEDNIHEAI
jgi:hypothetical protein